MRKSRKTKREMLEELDDATEKAALKHNRKDLERFAKALGDLLCHEVAETIKKIGKESKKKF